MKIIILLILLYAVFMLFADDAVPDSTFNIQGRVSFSKNVTVTVTCLTQIEFEEELPAKYFFVKELTNLDRERSYVDYIITDIPAGEYLIFAFQDKNENDKLDKILVVPRESWHIYGLPRPTTGKPQFSELSIYIDKNMSDLDMQLKNGF
ncbi:MAG: DUF2141 domain-containing protein [Candidatus Stygibacter australis]|nr:DUF2141 domain-containing protein [Candidatus Stygibacter australis]MDP8322044.1 DUF2141 domain-containing protein [Candidatus Stygibacter australis]